MTAVDSAHPSRRQFPGTLESIAEVRQWLQQLGKQHQWQESTAYAVQISLDELLTNAVRYGHPGTDQPHAIMVEVHCESGAIHITMEDDGIPFDPFHEAAEPELDADLEHRKVGGLGVHIVKTMMDEYHYQRVENRNRIQLTRRL